LVSQENLCNSSSFASLDECAWSIELCPLWVDACGGLLFSWWEKRYHLEEMLYIFNYLPASPLLWVWYMLFVQVGEYLGAYKVSNLY
jgi:hypothetical protein